MSNSDSGASLPHSALQFNDAVTVTVTSILSNDADSSESVTTTLLEGVVLYQGAVSFEIGDDWVGVRLTGKSVGQGRNNGTVQGQVYFECPEKCGIFVRASAVQKRNLTRLEELRLRREMGASSSASSAAISTATTPPRSAAKSASTGITPPRSTASTSTSAAKTKLEELRQRRAALKTKPDASGPSNSVNVSNSNPPSRSTSMSNLETEELQKQLEQVTQQLQQERERANQLQEQVQQAQKDMQLLQQQQQQQPTKESPLSQTVVEATQQQNLELQSTQAALTEQLQNTQRELAELQATWSRERAQHETVLDQCTRARAEATAYQNQLQTLLQQKDQRGAHDASHYKERAKLQADLSAGQRLVEQLQREKMELEAMVEDITLDKEQLLEEKEALADKYEELKLDAETAQMEVEELRMELEDARATAERVHSVAETLTGAALVQAGSPSKTIMTSEHNPEESAAQVQALQMQNARLREALIRLREQSALEKMELTRQLRTVEKDAQVNTAAAKQIEELQAANQQMQEQISDLKDMVEQGAAFEGMVEDLSDRLMQMEENSIALRATIRELEEAAELTAEMEEVQTEELKALSLDLEGRDTIIRNLEEAIRMQRRREDDFRRTVGNYKTTVDTLKQEKQALLELQQGDEGEKSSLIASSQKAFSRAAQLVADAAELRKREAQAVMDRLDRELYQHMSTRLETLLPHSVVATELASIKGELMACRVVGKSSVTLAGIAASFRKNIRPPLPQTVDKTRVSASLDQLILPDEVQQQISTMMNQGEFARLLTDGSSHLLRLLMAGQWPELLSPESSTELGAILGHSIPNLDMMLTQVLKSLKEEGSLTVEQSNVGELRLAFQNTVQSLKHDVERGDRTIVSPSWNPPGWKLLKDASLAKFSCLEAAAALSLAVDALPDGSDSMMALNVLYNRVEQCSSRASNLSLRLAVLDLKNEKLLVALAEEFSNLVSDADALSMAVKDLLLSGGSGGMENSNASAEATLRVLAKISSVLRAENLVPNEDERHHPISPELDDAWYGVTTVARAVRALDGDSEDVNFLLRAHAIEHQLGDAVEKEPLLMVAQSRVANLEKVVSSRSKELAMQNARLSELEKLVAKSNSTPVGRSKGNFDFASSEEHNRLKEENRVLTEAMEVMQGEIEMYENEVRQLRDFKSPGKKGKNTPRRSMSDISSPIPRGGGAVEDAQQTSALEAALFRPFLQEALQDAARWKASAVSSAMANLAPLPSLQAKHAMSDDWIRLSAAMAAARLQKASLTLVDLTDMSKTPRAQLRALKAKQMAADQRLESIVIQCQGRAQ